MKFKEIFYPLKKEKKLHKQKQMSYVIIRKFQSKNVHCAVPSRINVIVPHALGRENNMPKFFFFSFSSFFFSNEIVHGMSRLN